MTKIYTGKQSFEVEEYSTIIIKADAPFNTYACIGKEILQVLGPFSDGQKILKFKVPQGVDNILVKTSQNTTWQYQKQLPLKVNTDSTPIEVPIEQPRSMKEEIQMYLTQAFMDVVNQKEHETPEDIFNFNEDEDDQSDYKTKYTIDENDLTREEAQELERLLKMSEDIIPPGQQKPADETTTDNQERPATEDSTRSTPISEKTNIQTTPPQPGS